MSYYTGAAVRLKVRKNAPLPILEFLDRVFLKGELSDGLLDLLAQYGKQFGGTALATFQKPEVLEDIEDLDSMFIGWSAYLDTWCWRCKEEDGDCLVYESRASCKYPNHELLAQVISFLLPALEVQNGDILIRELGESWGQENVWYYEEGVLLQADGYEWPEGQFDRDHPWGQKLQCDDSEVDRLARRDDWMPPWNYYEIKGVINNAVGCQDR